MFHNLIKPLNKTFTKEKEVITTPHSRVLLKDHQCSKAQENDIMPRKTPLEEFPFLI